MEKMQLQPPVFIFILINYIREAKIMHVREKTASNKRSWKKWEATGERMKLGPFPPCIFHK